MSGQGCSRLRASNEGWFIWSIWSISSIWLVWLVGPEIHQEEPDRRTRARCASTEGTQSKPTFYPIHHIEEWPRLPFTARIERAHSYRARSASKKGTWPLPHLFPIFATSAK